MPWWAGLFTSTRKSPLSKKARGKIPQKRKPRRKKAR